MQVSADPQPFNSVNKLRSLGQWMQMFIIPNQSSVATSYKEYDEAGRMLLSAFAVEPTPLPPAILPQCSQTV